MVAERRLVEAGGRAGHAHPWTLDGICITCYVTNCMSKTSFILLGIFTSAAILTGCSAFTPATVSPTSYAVSSGAASTNDSVVVADLKLAQALNKADNPTQSEPLIDTGLGGLIMLASAFGGWLVRHNTNPKNPANVGK
jgi:hypothetical protein